MPELRPSEPMQAYATGGLRNPHPNDIDRKRIERALDARRRYRYVTPKVVPINNGYEILSPCCSRRIDKEGGVVPIARLVHSASTCRWRVYRQDHTLGIWALHVECASLSQVLELLRDDPDRSFWQ